MQKQLFLVLTLVALFSCREANKKDAIEEIADTEFNIEKWPKKTLVNPIAADILKEWPEYVSLETSFEGIYRVENTEDLALIIEDLIEKQKLLAESEYPETFDKPHIKSRQVALKTYILKTKGSLEYRLDLQEPVIEMIESFNALRNQFNVIVNNTFDAKLILDGQ
jgi:hypothetical protein